MSNNNIEFSLILACYNEGLTFESNLARICEFMNGLRIKYEIIFVEDKSTDDTKSKITNFCKIYKKTRRSIYHPINCGRGKSVSDGILAARGKIVGFIDVDCEVSPVYIPEAIDLIKKNLADVVVGKRYYQVSIGSLIRSTVSGGYRKLASLLLPTRGIDTESGYKFFNRKKILPILKYAYHPGWFWDTQIVVMSLLKNLKVVELPVLFIRRTDKDSTVKVIQDSIDYLTSIWRFYRHLRSKKIN